MPHQKPPSQAQIDKEYPTANTRAMKDAMRSLGSRALDKRTKAAHVLAEWRVALIEDLGGEGVVSKMQEALVDLAVREKLLLDSIDAWMFKQKTLIEKKHVIGVVKERQVVSDALARYLTALGLDKRKKARKGIGDAISVWEKRKAAEEALKAAQGADEPEPEDREDYIDEQIEEGR